MLALADSAAGKRALCPSCEAEFRVPTLQSPGREPAAAQLPRSGIRCPACERPLAFDASLAGQTIICPTCQRRLRMPAAGERVADLGPVPAMEPAGTWRPAHERTSTANPPSYEENPYSPLATPSETPASPDFQANYALPGFFLVALSGPALLFVGLYLITIILGVAAGGAVPGPAEMVIIFMFFFLAALSHGATLIGGIQMITRRRLDLARLGAWAALYPCGFCTVIQIPFAIWALVVLHRASAPADFASPVVPATNRLP